MDIDWSGEDMMFATYDRHGDDLVEWCGLHPDRAAYVIESLRDSIIEEMRGPDW